jgi:hypothetical protein
LAVKIGLQHGREACDLIHQGVDFYRGFFKEWASLTWEEASEAAVKFLPFLEEQVPHLIEEMKGMDEKKSLLNKSG